MNTLYYNKDNFFPKCTSFVNQRTPYNKRSEHLLYLMENQIQLHRQYPFMLYNQTFGRSSPMIPESWNSPTCSPSSVPPPVNHSPSLTEQSYPSETPLHTFDSCQRTIRTPQTLPLNLCISDQVNTIPHSSSNRQNFRSEESCSSRKRIKPSAMIGKRNYNKKDRKSGQPRCNLAHTCAVCDSHFTHIQHLNDHFLATHQDSILSNMTQTVSPKVHFRAQLETLLSEEKHETTTRTPFRSVQESKFSGKGYQCPKCNYLAKWPTELQKHVMVHSCRRPFVCFVCSTSYKWSWDLGRHFANSHPTLPNPYKKLSKQATCTTGKKESFSIESLLNS